MFIGTTKCIKIEGGGGIKYFSKGFTCKKFVFSFFFFRYLTRKYIYWWFANFVSSIYLWNCCEKLSFLSFLFEIFLSGCFIKQKQILCASNQQTTSSKVLKMPFQWSICRMRPSKRMKMKFT